MNLIPFKLSDHLIHYFFKEFEGTTHNYRGKSVKSIPINPNSTIGKYIICHLRKIDYPITNISQFNLFIEMNVKERTVYCSKQKLFKKENISNSFVELPEEYMTDVNNMLDDLFRQNFFYFVEGYSKDEDQHKIRKGIRLFLDKYDLWEFEQFNEWQLSKLYYRMLREKPGTRLQNRKQV